MKLPEPPPVTIESTLNRVASFLSPKSVVPAGPATNKEGYVGPPKEYASGSFNLVYRVNQDPKDFEEIENRFKNTLDSSGRSMLEVCKEYWRKKRLGS